MRLACYGWVDAEGGSVASANYLVLRELFGRRVAVDLYANEDHVSRPQGLDSNLFQYIGVKPPRPYRHVSPRVQRAVNWAFDPVVRRAWKRIYDPVVAERSRRVGGYDAVLSLGTPPAFDL